MLSAIKNKLTSLLQLILVMTYILFEEIIWEGIAKPVYEKIHALQIIQRMEHSIEKIPGYGILVIFLLLLLLVQGAGIFAGVLFLSGKFLFGLFLYLSKIPIAAFTFWIFRISEDKLMQFGWFKWLYEWIMKAIEWLKTREMYVKTMERLIEVKINIKKTFQSVKEKYFASESPFITKIKSLYKTVKASLKK